MVWYFDIIFLIPAQFVGTLSIKLFSILHTKTFFTITLNAFDVLALKTNLYFSKSSVSPPNWRNRVNENITNYVFFADKLVNRTFPIYTACAGLLFFACLFAVDVYLIECASSNKWIYASTLWVQSVTSLSTHFLH